MEKENKMGTMSINKLLVSMSLPIIVAMLIQALYNIVDSIFVAQISENALTAVSLTFPIQSLMIAVAGGTGVGINAVISRNLGKKDYDKVNKTANTAIVLGVISSLVFAILAFLFHDIFFSIQTSNAEIVEYGSQYMLIVTGLSIGMFMQFVGERLLQATGRSMETMFIQGLGAIINIVLDPILIFGYFGLPALGVAGAAYATVIGQIVAAILGLYVNIKRNTDIQIRLKGFVLEFAIIKQIYAIGIPSIVMQSIGSVMTFGMNTLLVGFTTTATAVFGIYFKLQSFIFMPIFGMNNALIPIIAYNYGAEKKERLKQTIRYASIYAVGIMAIGLFIFQVFPSELLLLFNASETMIEIGVPALRLISLCFIFAGFNIIYGSTFQALGKGGLSLIVSVVRQLVVLLPVAYGLSFLGNVTYVWWAFPISEVVAMLLSLFYLRKMYVIINAIKEPEQELEPEPVL